MEDCKNNTLEQIKKEPDATSPENRSQPNIQNLKEVTVTEQRSLFEEKSDRLVYHAEKDIGVKGGDATDVLKKIPSIAVDIEGNVQLRGSSNIPTRLRPITVSRSGRPALTDLFS